MSEWLRTYDPETKKLHVHPEGTVVVGGQIVRLDVDFSLEGEEE